MVGITILIVIFYEKFCCKEICCNDVILYNQVCCWWRTDLNENVDTASVRPILNRKNGARTLIAGCSNTTLFTSHVSDKAHLRAARNWQVQMTFLDDHFPGSFFFFHAISNDHTFIPLFRMIIAERIKRAQHSSTCDEAAHLVLCQGCLTVRGVLGVQNRRHPWKWQSENKVHSIFGRSLNNAPHFFTFAFEFKLSFGDCMYNVNYKHIFVTAITARQKFLPDYIRQFFIYF